jgi:glyoxylase-like metal-dependent hydrolase (beta-lactamase superfamily II)
MGEFDLNEELDVLTLQKLNIGPYNNNVFVLTCKETTEGVIVDTSFSADPILAACSNTKVKYILQTHCHGDHVDALPEVRKRTSAPLGLHPEESKTYGIKGEFSINDGDTITFGKVSLKAIHAPGHSPGMLMFYYPGHCICGDVVFPGGPGKTSDHNQLLTLIDSIKKKVHTLPDDTALYPGHGADTTVGESKKQLAAFEAVDRPKAGEFGDINWSD